MKTGNWRAGQLKQLFVARLFLKIFKL